jgi:hypothetical protein
MKTLITLSWLLCGFKTNLLFQFSHPFWPNLPNCLGQRWQVTAGIDTRLFHYLPATPNGAGKTTAAFTLLPGLLNCREFINADEIALGLSPFRPETVSIQAGRLMLARLQELLAAGGYRSEAYSCFWNY